MENFFIPTDTEVIENFKNQNLKKEDYYDIISESDPEFLLKDYHSQRSTWDDDEPKAKSCDANHFSSLAQKVGEGLSVCNIEPPHGFMKIRLYDYEKSLKDNFKDDAARKYILIEVTREGSMVFLEDIPVPQSKFVVSMAEIDKFGTLENLILDYDSIFGTRFISFLKYDSNFFICDERVMFEAMLIKFKAFGYKPFYWSKQMIYKEAGIKKDRATKIIERFLKLGVIKSVEIVKRVIDNRPQQVTYFDLDSDKIIDLLPDIFKGREDNCDMVKEITKYLNPSTIGKMQ